MILETIPKYFSRHIIISTRPRNKICILLLAVLHWQKAFVESCHIIHLLYPTCRLKYIKIFYGQFHELHCFVVLSAIHQHLFIRFATRPSILFRYHATNWHTYIHAGPRWAELTHSHIILCHTDAAFYNKRNITSICSMELERWFMHMSLSKEFLNFVQ